MPAVIEPSPMIATTWCDSPRRSRARARPSAAEIEVEACPAATTSYSDSARRQKPDRPPYWRSGRHAVAAAGEDLVRIGLVPDVPDQQVARGLEGVVERDRQLDRAQVRGEVAAGLRDAADDLLAQLVGELSELVDRELAQVGGQVDAVEQVVIAQKVPSGEEDDQRRRQSSTPARQLARRARPPRGQARQPCPARRRRRTSPE